MQCPTMKTSLCLLWMLMVPSLAAASIVGGLVPVSGGGASGGRYGVVCGPPMYDYFTGCAEVSVSITNPQNGSTLFWSLPSVTENVTVSILGATPSFCEYQIDSGNWTSFDHCGAGENQTWSMLTMPEGYPVTFNVRIRSGCGEVSNLTQFTVVYPTPREGKTIPTLIFGLIAFLVVLLVLDPRRRRKRRRKR